MIWIYVAVGLAVAGLVALALLAARVLSAVKGLAGEIERATSRLGHVQGGLGSAIGASGQPEG